MTTCSRSERKSLSLLGREPAPNGLHSLERAHPVITAAPSAGGLLEGPRLGSRGEVAPEPCFAPNRRPVMMKTSPQRFSPCLSVPCARTRERILSVTISCRLREHAWPTSAPLEGPPAPWKKPYKKSARCDAGAQSLSVAFGVNMTGAQLLKLDADTLLLRRVPAPVIRYSATLT